MSTGRSNLALQGRGPDVNWFRDAKNTFAPKLGGWENTINHVPETFDFSIVSNSQSLAYGQTIQFDIDKRMDFWGKTELIVTRTADTSGSTATIIPAFNDFEAHSSIDVVRFKYNNRVFHECYGEELLKDLLQENRREIRNAHARLARGKLTEFERRALATQRTSWVLDLQVPWDYVNKQLPMWCLPNKITVEVTFKPLNMCCRVLGTGTPIFTLLMLHSVVNLFIFQRKKKTNFGLFTMEVV